MKVKLLREQAGKMDRHSDWPPVGSVVDLWEPKAQYLISVGDAEPVYAAGGQVAPPSAKAEVKVGEQIVPRKRK
jgi:hypothetical protein